MAARSNTKCRLLRTHAMRNAAIVLAVFVPLCVAWVAVTAQAPASKATAIAAAGPQGQQVPPGQPQAQEKQGQEVELDHLVAVVGDHAILQSDVEDEIHFTALQSQALPAAQNTPEQALGRLIDRALIGNELALQPSFSAVSGEQVEQSIAELKKDIPACAHVDCSSAAGWKAFLQSQGFTMQEVYDRMKERLQVLKFIDWRFGPTIRTTPEDVRTYYQMVLLPQFAKKKVTPPPLEKVAPRIWEILEQQHITTLMDAWIKGLRSQGTVHIVDPAYASVGGAM